MLSIAKIIGADDAVTVDGSTVTLRRPRTSLTKQYQFDAACGDGLANYEFFEASGIATHVRTALDKCESLTVFSVGAQGAGKTTTLHGVAEAAIGAAFAALGTTAEERLVTFSALVSVVSGSPVRERLVDLLDDKPQPNAGLNVREHADGLPHAANFYADGLTQREVVNTIRTRCTEQSIAVSRSRSDEESLVFVAGICYNMGYTIQHYRKHTR